MIRRHLQVLLMAAGIAAASGAETTAGAATLQAQTVQAWNACVAATEARIAGELQSGSDSFTGEVQADGRATRAAVLSGAIPIGRVPAGDGAPQTDDVPGGLIQHWRGAVFLPGVGLASLLERIQHPSESGPHQQDVVALRVLARRPDHLVLAIRMTRSKIVTATYDTEHQVDYRRFGATRASSSSVSTKIVEIEDAGTPDERALPQGRDRGFLWRINSYWRYEQVAGGVLVELESLTLSRAVPLGLGFVVEPLIDRVARDSLSRTLDNLRRTYASGQGRTTRSN